MRNTRFRTCGSIRNTVVILAGLAAELVAWPARGLARPPAEALAPDRAVVGGASARFEVRGQVLGPNGKPVAGAEVSLYAGSESGKEPRSVEQSVPTRTVTDADGKYRFSAFRTELDGGFSVVATAKGCGPDWVSLSALTFDPVSARPPSGALPDLRLVEDDVPIAGRALDLESQPLADVTLRVLRVRKSPGEDLVPFFKVWTGEAGLKRVAVAYEEGTMITLQVTREVKTNANGQFRLDGFGQDRVVILAVGGLGLEHRVVEVVTRAELPKGLSPIVRPANVDFLLAPSKPITGTVWERATGKPAVGVEVQGWSPQSVEANRATTNQQGRYRLTGMAKARAYSLAAQGGRLSDPPGTSMTPRAWRPSPRTSSWNAGLK